jgi:hypothetical protein
MATRTRALLGVLFSFIQMTTLFLQEISGLSRSRKKYKPMQKYGWAMSSVDENKIALTIRGAAKLIPALIILGGVFGLSLDAAELNNVLDSVLGVLAALVALWGTIETLIGAGRKIAVRLKLI